MAGYIFSPMDNEGQHAPSSKDGSPFLQWAPEPEPGRRCLAGLLLRIAAIALQAWTTRLLRIGSKQSDAELDYPEDTREVAEEVGRLLARWNPGRCRDRDRAIKELFYYLHWYCEWEVQLRPDFSCGMPDVLVGSNVAIEVMWAPDSKEQERVLGQCRKLARTWKTWLVLVDAAPEQAARVGKRMQDRGLEHIPLQKTVSGKRQRSRKTTSTRKPRRKTEL